MKFYLDSKETGNTKILFYYLQFITKHSLSNVLFQIEILLKIFLTLSIVCNVNYKIFIK